jgi:MFS family permease
MIASAGPSRLTTGQTVEAWPNPRYAWYVVIMLMVSYAFSIIDRTALSLLIQPIEADLHISDGSMGLLQGLAFAVFYSVLGFPIGFLADRVNRRRLISLGITVWSFATVMCGFAGGFGGLFLARIGVGAGEATLSPAGASMIADYFPPQTRSKAFAINAMGTTFGVGIAFLLGGAAIQLAENLRQAGPEWLAALAPWKIVFFIIGAPGIVVGIIFALTVREPKRRDLAGIDRRASLKPLFSMLSIRWPVYAGLLIWSVLNSISIYALISWFPALLIRLHGWTPSSVGEILGVFSVPAGIFSCVSGGWSVAWLQKGRVDAPVLVAIGATAWCMIAGIAAALAPSGNLAVVFYCILGLATNNGGIAILTAIMRITPNELRGQVLALLAMSTGLISVTVGPFAVGFLSDHVYGQPLGIGKSMATVFAVAGCLGIFTLLKTRRRFAAAVREWSQTDQELNPVSVDRP